MHEAINQRLHYTNLNAGGNQEQNFLTPTMGVGQICRDRKFKGLWNTFKVQGYE